MAESIEHVREALRQVVEGDDFEPPSKLLKTVKADAAVRVVAGLPYSLATNVAHADIWTRLWLARVEGKPKLNPFPDFPVVKEKDWPNVRDQFVGNLQRAYDIACAEPFEHHCKNDESAVKTLLKIAVHSAYHLGQIKLLKRALRAKQSD
jgi:hypothetical protein